MKDDDISFQIDNMHGETTIFWVVWHSAASVINNSPAVRVTNRRTPGTPRFMLSWNILILSPISTLGSEEWISWTYDVLFIYSCIYTISYIYYSDSRYICYTFSWTYNVFQFIISLYLVIWCRYMCWSVCNCIYVHCTCICCNLVDTPFLNLMLCKSRMVEEVLGIKGDDLAGASKCVGAIWAFSSRRSTSAGAHKIRGGPPFGTRQKPSLRRLWLWEAIHKKDYDIRWEFFTLNVLQYHTLWRQFVVWPHMTSTQHFASFLGKSQFSSENFGRWNMNRYDTLTYNIEYMVGPVTRGSKMWFQPFTRYPSWPGNSTLELRPRSPVAKFRVTGWTSSSLGGDELRVNGWTGRNGWIFNVKTCSATFRFGESTKNIHLTSVDSSSPKN